MSDIIHIKGRKIDQKKLRKFLEELDMTNIDQFQTEDGLWESPITGEKFRTKQQLWGQLGAYLRTINPKDPMEPTRAGYVRALRRGMEPTREQKRAHAEYNKAFRRKRKDRIAIAKGIDPKRQKPEPDKDKDFKVPVMSME